MPYSLPGSSTSKSICLINDWVRAPVVWEELGLQIWSWESSMFTKFYMCYRVPAALRPRAMCYRKVTITSHE